MSPNAPKQQTLLSASAFVGGWVLNFIGHGRYEKNQPAFADDPLSFIAGPAWDFMQLFGNQGESAAATPVDRDVDRSDAPAAQV